MLDGSQSSNNTTPTDDIKPSGGRCSAPNASPQERVYEAQRKASEAETRLERERRKSRAKEEKVRRKRARNEILSRFMTPKRLIGTLAVVAVIIGFCGLALPGILQSGEGVTYLSATELEKVVSINKLATAEYVYNGIAEIENENGDVTQRIYYASTVKAGVDLTDIDFDVNNETMTVTPTIPEIEVYDPSIDTSSFDYIPRNPNLELGEIIGICKADALAEIDSQGEIYRTAEINLRKTVEALTLPLLESKGYDLVWQEEPQDSTEGNENDAGHASEEVSDGE